MQYWFFGLPGVGKDYCARRFSQMTGLQTFEGDDFHTADDREVIARNEFTVERRWAQLARIAAEVPSDAIISHVLADRESRARVLGFNGGATKLVFITAEMSVIKERLRNRRDHHFTADMLEPWIPKHWQEPGPDQDCFLIRSDKDDDTIDRRLDWLRK